MYLRFFVYFSCFLSKFFELILNENFLTQQFNIYFISLITIGRFWLSTIDMDLHIDTIESP